MYKESNGFIACAGTLIYKGQFGKDALKDLFNDLEYKTLTQIRQNLLGCYVVIYKRNQQIKVFVDETGTYAFYYYKDTDGNYLLTNTYYHIEKMVKQPVNQLAFIEEELEFGILDNQTPYENIYRILGSELVLIGKDKPVFSIKQIELNRYVLKEKTLDDIAKHLNACLQNTLSTIKSIMAEPYLFMTGGVDSRLLLANYLKAGVKPVLGSWFNAPITMNSKQEDLISVKKIADKMNLTAVSIDVDETGIDYGQNFLNQCEKLGEYALIYGGNLKWHNILQDYDIQYADYGFFGEMLKDWTELEVKKGKKINLEWFVKMYMNRTYYANMQRDVTCYQQLYDRIYKEFFMIAQKENMDINHMSCKDCMKLYYWYRIHADSVRYAYANMFCYSFPLYAQQEIADYINDVPYEMKENAKLNLRMEQMLAEQLLEIPFFSHCSYMKYDNKKMELTSESTRTITATVVHALRGKNGMMKEIYDFYLKIKRNITNGEKGGYTDICVETLRRSETFLNLNMNLDGHSINYVPRLIHLTQACIIADELCKIG